MIGFSYIPFTLCEAVKRNKEIDFSLCDVKLDDVKILRVYQYAILSQKAYFSHQMNKVHSLFYLFSKIRAYIPIEI